VVLKQEFLKQRRRMWGDRAAHLLWVAYVINWCALPLAILGLVVLGLVGIGPALLVYLTLTVVIGLRISVQSRASRAASIALGSPVIWGFSPPRRDQYEQWCRTRGVVPYALVHGDLRPAGDSTG
jgi:hypothetical protein